MSDQDDGALGCEADSDEASDRSRQNPDAPGLVVGIGGSAGAFEALKHVLSHLPADAGMAYVVVKHIDARSPGALVDSLARYCRIPVQLASDGVRVDRDRIYVTAPGMVLEIRDGTLRVTSRSGTQVRDEIDVFLSSLAEDQGSRAVGIVLSGMGSDGVAGLRSIRAHDGLAIVQSPETSLYDAMPEAAITAGVADLVLRVEDMPSALLQQASGRSDLGAREARKLAREVRCRLPAITDILRRATGHDFSRYKEGTLTRRVRRRMDMLQLRSVDDYVRTLDQHAVEAEQLFKDLLIGVSQFFRDVEAFEVLAERVIPQILDARADDIPVRIWVPGCSSGEEAYSLAMLVREQLVARASDRLVQVFATDIDIGMLAVARRGRYPLDIEQYVSTGRLDRFFLRDAHGWEVRPELREMTVFSLHNLVRDPPFSSLDLISCRNLLIYLKPDLQRRLVPMFHYALRAGGFLFLGPSEGLSAHPNLFATIDKRHRIFRRNDAVETPPLDLPHVRHRAVWGRLAPATTHPPGPPNPMALRAFERIVLEEFTPATVAIDERGEIVFVAGRTSRYLQPPPGGLSHNLFDHVRSTLRRDVRLAVEQASRASSKVTRDPVRVDIDGQPRLVRITVRPLPSLPPHGPLFAVVLEDSAAATDVMVSPPNADEPVLEQLEAELHATRSELQAAIEELETANAELRSSNEELVSTNEELQSANEEMQTSREELQSANEELETLNADLHEKAAALSEANDYLQNLLAATQIATIFLDARLCITKYTPAARGVFHLIEADVGRALEDLAPKVELGDLIADCRRVLESNEATERQVRTASGDRWFAARFLPYRRLEGTVDGVVATFVDITDLKATEAALREREAEASRRLAEFDAIFDAMSFPIIVYDAQGHPVRVNRRTREVFGIEREGTDAAGCHQLGIDLKMRTLDGQPLAPEMRASSRALRGEMVIDQLTVVADPQRGDRIVEITAIPLKDGQAITGAVLGWRDVTEKLAAERALREQQQLLHDVIDGTPTLIFIKDTQGRFVTINRALEGLMGLTREQVRGKRDDELPAGRAVIPFCEHDREVLQTGIPQQREQAVALSDGSQRTHLVDRFPLRDSAGVLYGVCGIAFDITDRKAAEEQRLALERQMFHAQKLESLGVLAGGIAHEFNNLLLAILGNLDLACEEIPVGTSVRTGLETAMQAARKAADLARQMLAFAGKGAFLLARVDLGQVVKDNVPLMQASIPKHVILRVHLPGAPACVEADLGQMQQVLMNLVSNAADAIGDGAGAIDLSVGISDFDASTMQRNRTEVRLPPGRYAYVEVRDDGRGMPAATMERLFDPFFSTKGAGRGLGMAALQGIVRAHHGAVLVDSDPGKGTRVRILLPPCSPDQTVKLRPVEERQHQEKSVGQILVVDDEDAVREVCARIVRRLGYRTVTARDGIEAIEVLRAHDDIHCVILDMSMPRMGGIAALAEIKRIDSSIPVIMSSGFSEEQLKQESRGADVAGFITKPYDIKTLAQVLAAVLRRA
jgi:two-component system CheB/CheR fusion protein